MKKYNPLRSICLLLLAVVFIFFSYKNLVYSKTDTPDIALESNPRGIVINPITDIAVVANEKSDSVSIVNLNTQAVISTIPGGKAPRGVAIDRGLNLAVIGNSKDNTVSIIDLSSFSVIKTIPVGKEPEGIAVNQLNHTALIANHKDNTVSVIDLLTLTATGTILVGQEPKDVAIDPNLNLALVVNEKDYNVSVIDLNTNQVTGTVSVGQKPQSIDINPETHLAVVVNEKDNSITVINLLNWQTTTILVGKHPIAVAINQLDNRALVICDEDRTLLLIDLNTNIIIKTYPLNKLPKGIAVNHFTNIAGIVDDKTDSLTLIQLPNPVSKIIAINPDTLIRGSNETMITVEGSGFIRASSVSLLTPNPYTLTPLFTDNHHLEITIPEDFLKKAGTYQITITNPTPDGGTSNPVNLQINNPIPTISAIDPLETKTNVQSLILTIYGTGFFPDTEIYFGNTKKPITYISPIKLQINLIQEDLKTAGEYEITARNLSPGGGTSNKVIFTIKPSLEITITSPIDGETINKAKTIVKGTFKSDSKDVGITVNGIIADVIPEVSNRGTSSQWIANGVPLAVGANTITAVATDSYGNTDTKTITVYTNDITQQVELSANITSGIPPLQVYFSASTEIPNPITTYQMDFEGDGIIDYTGTTFEDINHTYTSEGIFYPTLTVTDAQANIYSDTIAITVLNKAEIDTLLKGKWEGMKGGLTVGDIDSAVSYFDDFSKDDYKEMFIAFSTLLPQIVQELNDVQIIKVIENTAEYDIRTIRDGTEYSFYLLFVKDGNGLWKIRSF